MSLPSDTETQFQPLEMFMVLDNLSQAGDLAWILLLHVLF